MLRACSRGAACHITLPPGVIRFGLGRLWFLGLGLLTGCYSLNWAWNLLPTHRPIPIANLQAPVFPFAHRHLALRRRMVSGLSVYLEIAVIVSHHPVVAEDSPGFLMKNFLQLRRPRGRSMIVLGLGRHSPKPPIVFRQIFFLQKQVRLHMGL